MIIDPGKRFEVGDNTVLYAAAWVDSSEVREAVAWVRTAAGIKMWLNRELVYQHGLIGDSVESRIEERKVSLRKGRNRLLLKLACKDDTTKLFFSAGIE